MKRRVLWIVLAAIPAVVIATLAWGKMNSLPEPPEISLGVMRSCAQMGALAKRIALDKEKGIKVDAQRYRLYSEQLARQQPLFNSPRFALLLAYGSEELETEVIRKLGVQACIASYYGFHGEHYLATLQEEALACQLQSREEDEPTLALNDCMGKRYQTLLAKWWHTAYQGESETSTLAWLRGALGKG